MINANVQLCVRSLTSLIHWCKLGYHNLCISNYHTYKLFLTCNISIFSFKLHVWNYVRLKCYIECRMIFIVIFLYSSSYHVLLRISVFISLIENVWIILSNNSFLFIKLDNSLSFHMWCAPTNQRKPISTHEQLIDVGIEVENDP